MTGLEHQHDHRFIVLVHQYAGRDVTWKRSLFRIFFHVFPFFFFQEKLTGLSDLKKSVVETNNNITDTEKEVRNALNMTKSIKGKVKIVETRYERIIEELDV